MPSDTLRALKIDFLPPAPQQRRLNRIAYGYTVLAAAKTATPKETTGFLGRLMSIGGRIS